MRYPNLLSEGRIGKLTIRNRTVLAPMVTGFANYDGSPSEKLIGYYEERARNGLGLLITGATRVNNFQGVIIPKQTSMARDRNIAPFAAMVDRMHAHGTKVFCQLHHPGRQGLSLIVTTCANIALMGRIWPGFYDLIPKLPLGDERVEAAGAWMLKHTRWPAVVAPSAVISTHYNQRTRALKKWEIKRLVGQFVDAAVRVKKSGADGVELHGAHGYLIQQFLSSQSNRRRDEYGGGLDNRMRFLEEIIDGVRRECGKDFPVTVRLTVDEFYREIGLPGQGIELDEGVEMARRLERAGIDAINVSSANYETMNWWLEPMSFEPGWRKHLARAVKEAVDIPVIAANLIRTPEQAEAQIAEGIQDFAALGRPLLADPAWVAKAMEDRAGEITRCISCLWCMESMEKNGTKGLGIECTVNPRLGREQETSAPRLDGAGRAVAVIGAGPAGLKAAEVLGHRGFKPTVFEHGGSTGGQLNLGDKPPGKGKIDWCTQDLEGAAARSGAEIRLNTEASVDELKALDPYAVIVATGGLPIVPKIPGVDRKHVCTVNHILDGSVVLEGKTVAMIGSGMTGLETAELLAGQGNKTIIVEMLDEIGPGAFIQNLDDVLLRLKPFEPEFITSHKLVEIGEGEIILENVKTGGRIGRTVDQVVLSVGVRSDDHLMAELKPSFPRVLSIGDARQVGRIYSAVRDGFDTAFDL